MSCYHPKKVWIDGFKDNGKKNIVKFTDYSVDHLEFYNGAWQVALDGFISKRAKRCLYESETVPCGHCIGCRLDYSRDWAVRMMLELEYHSEAWFCTFTYDDEHIKPLLRHGANPATGECLDSYTVCVRDFQLFMKSLRQKSSKDLRYFACLEYGGETRRPHVHAIIYSLHLSPDELKFYKRVNFNAKGRSFSYNLYKSLELEKIWENGFVTVGECTFESCAYTARYVTKKLNGLAAEKYKILNIEPEKSLMSLKPGIGRFWYEDHKDDLIQNKYINISTPAGGLKVLPPKYFRDRLLIDFPDEYSKLKVMAKEYAEYRTQLECAGTTLDYEDYLKVCEEALDDRITLLKGRSKL